MCCDFVLAHTDSSSTKQLSIQLQKVARYDKIKISKFMKLYKIVTGPIKKRTFYFD